MLKAKRPRVALFENVKNLLTHDNGNTFSVIQRELKDAGYHPICRVLNAMSYGNMAQNRERIYIVAFRDEVQTNSQTAEAERLRDSIELDSYKQTADNLIAGMNKGEVSGDDIRNFITDLAKAYNQAKGSNNTVKADAIQFIANTLETGVGDLMPEVIHGTNQTKQQNQIGYRGNITGRQIRANLLGI